jgi:hypothetical protein
LSVFTSLYSVLLLFTLFFLAGFGFLFRSCVLRVIVYVDELVEPRVKSGENAAPEKKPEASKEEEGEKKEN